MAEGVARVTESQAMDLPRHQDQGTRSTEQGIEVHRGAIPEDQLLQGDIQEDLLLNPAQHIGKRMQVVIQIGTGKGPWKDEVHLPSKEGKDLITMRAGEAPILIEGCLEGEEKGQCTTLMRESLLPGRPWGEA
ncbi:MAG: hypothetical protein JSW28_01765 [Thermoplasmata archaeon]|nr:MAG: hypothetical protein JSW28_01765 [Thermoplasmata archaeon]